MARIEQVIHVKGADGVVRECALFDDVNDIPSPATAREFGLNGAKIYGAVGNQLDLTGGDEEWLYANNATELAFREGNTKSRLLTTPYYIRPLAESLEFGPDGGEIYLSDLLSTNGGLLSFSCDYDNVRVLFRGSTDLQNRYVSCAANTGNESVDFTLVLTFTFADGSTQDITFSGRQRAVLAPGAYIAYVQNGVRRACTHDQWFSISPTPEAQGIIVSDGTHEILVAPGQTDDLPWGRYATASGAAVTEDGSAALADFRGMVNTAAEVAAGNGSTDCPTGWCDAYSYGEVGAGGWWLPALGELSVIFDHKDEADALMELFGWDTIESSFDFYWGSTLISSDLAWCLDFRNGNPENIMDQGLNQAAVRPVSEWEHEDFI